MADNQSGFSSSVAPSDSASTPGKKRSKPGKAERAARRSVVGSQPGQSAHADKASMFASGPSVPKPAPGKYPVVFQTGAGEPARDKTFSIDERVLQSTLKSFPTRLTYNAKYAEFKAHAEIDDLDFSKDLTIAALLRLAQQVVHSHVNMGLPQGDFSVVASTEVRVPASVSAYLYQFGEHSVPSIGTRFLFSGYEETVSRLVLAADKIRSEGDPGPVIGRSWLPMNSSDRHTRAIIASRLQEFLKAAEVSVEPQVLEDGVLSGTVPDAWIGIKGFFGDADPQRDRFDFLFKSYASEALFSTAFTTTAASAVLTELGLPWIHPSAGHLNWTYNVKEAYTRLADRWAKKSTTYGQFFELSSSLANRSAASGSQAQMAQVTTVDSVTVVKTYLALSAPEFSLAACFPATCVYTGDVDRKVVVTTPLSVQQRATEFVQMDWRA
jgi:hypothetical protein